MARLTATDQNGRVFTRYSETFTLKHNAVRAARRSLGREAQPGADFQLEQLAEGWTWRTGSHAPASEKSSSSPASRPGAMQPAHTSDQVASRSPAPAEWFEARKRAIAAPAIDPSTVEALLRLIALEHSIEPGPIVIQALHTAYAEGTVAEKRKRRPRRPLFLFNEALSTSAGIRPN